jgi:hypothetical protein
VARRRDATVEAHADANEKEVASAAKAHREAERQLDEAKIMLEGLARRADRAVAAVGAYERDHAEELLEDLRPEADQVTAERLELVGRLIELDTRRTALSQDVARYVTASGHRVQGNLEADDVLAQAMPILRDVAAGLRPLARRCRPGSTAAPSRPTTGPRPSRPRRRAPTGQPPDG